MASSSSASAKQERADLAASRPRENAVRALVELAAGLLERPSQAPQVDPRDLLRALADGGVQLFQHMRRLVAPTGVQQRLGLHQPAIGLTVSRCHRASPPVQGFERTEYRLPIAARPGDTGGRETRVVHVDRKRDQLGAARRRRDVVTSVIFQFPRPA